MSDSTPWYVKASAGALGLLAVMVLALTHAIDGSKATDAVMAIVGVFLGSSAILGGAQSLARAVASKPVTAVLESTTSASASPAKAAT